MKIDQGSPEARIGRLPGRPQRLLLIRAGLIMLVYAAAIGFLLPSARNPALALLTHELALGYGGLTLAVAGIWRDLPAGRARDAAGWSFLYSALGVLAAYSLGVRKPLKVSALPL